MRRQRASALPGREVRYGDIRLGIVVDVLFDLEVRAVLGFDVRCGDERVRFLPTRACDLGRDHVAVLSPFLLLDDGFYRAHGRLLSTVAGTPVREAGRPIGRLVDVIVDYDGTPTRLRVETTDGERELAVGPRVGLDAKDLRPAV